MKNKPEEVKITLAPKPINSNQIKLCTHITYQGLRDCPNCGNSSTYVDARTPEEKASEPKSFMTTTADFESGKGKCGKECLRGCRDVNPLICECSCHTIVEKGKCVCGEQELLGNGELEIGGVCHRPNNPCYCIVVENTLEGWDSIMDKFFAICKELHLKEETVSGKCEWAGLKDLIVKAYDLGKSEAEKLLADK
jgi:hypothetical protein